MEDMNRSIVMPIAIAVALTLCRTFGAEPARTVAEVNAFTDEDYASSRHFEVCGTVTGVSGAMFVVDDGTNRNVFCYHLEIPATGRVIRVVGNAYIEGTRRRSLFAVSVDVVGQKAVPEPADATVEDVVRGKFDLDRVNVRGVVTDVQVDDIDPNCCRLTVCGGGYRLLASVSNRKGEFDVLRKMPDSEVRIIGLCIPASTGWRIFTGTMLSVNSIGDIRVLKRGPADVFDVEPLGEPHHVSPAVLVGLARRRVTGRVVAVWQGDHFLVETSRGVKVMGILARGVEPPRYGECASVVGYPGTDMFLVKLSSAVWRREENVSSEPDKPVAISGAELLADEKGRSRVDASHYGRTVKLKGVVRSRTDDGRLQCECDGRIVPVDASAMPNALDGIDVGCTLEITGLCILDADDWRPDSMFPSVRGLFVVPRAPEDLVVLKRPSWWTPARLLLVICSLLLVLVAFAVWIRILNRMVERRWRQLAREEVAHAGAELKSEERMRLAVDLHDTFSQNLTGVALQIDAIRLAAERDPQSLMTHVKTAQDKMRSCRENLRDCLCDLRSRAFEEGNLGTAIERTIAPHLGGVKVGIDCGVSCRGFSDNSIHAILCAVRELVVNAVRHGKAKHVTISGAFAADGLRVSVSDDGVGFDPEKRPGPLQGHFGLQGVEERVHRLGGTLKVTSVTGKGAAVVMSGLKPEKGN